MRQANIVRSPSTRYSSIRTCNCDTSAAAWRTDRNADIFAGPTHLYRPIYTFSCLVGCVFNTVQFHQISCAVQVTGIINRNFVAGSTHFTDNQSFNIQAISCFIYFSRFHYARKFLALYAPKGRLLASLFRLPLIRNDHSLPGITNSRNLFPGNHKGNESKYQNWNNFSKWSISLA